MNNHSGEIDELVNRYRKEKLRIIQQTAGMALSFFKKSFTDQGFTDVSLKKWKERIGGPNNQGRAILISRGVLKRGLRIKRVDKTGAVIGVDDAIKYADIHNNGGQIEITPQMRRFFWAMYYKHAGAKTKRKKTLNPLAAFWKGMALTKKSHLDIPERKFIGDSVTLERKLMAYVEQELTTLFKI